MLAGSSVFLSILLTIIWLILCTAGGIFLTGGLFKVTRAELPLIGAALGLVLDIFLTNFAAHFIPVSVAVWVAAAILFCGGIFAALPQLRRHEFQVPQFKWAIWLTLAASVFLFYAINRGLAIFDDYQNLPILSALASGDVPPHYPMDPSLGLGYHYFQLFLGAMFVPLSGVLPWIGLDLSKSIAICLALALAGCVAWRYTRSKTAVVLTVLFGAFSGGTRWLMLLLPPGILQLISTHVHLIGAGLSSAPDLTGALQTSWAIDGGPFPFPFAFANGINTPQILNWGGIGAMDGLIFLLILLTGRVWRSRWAAVPTALLFTALALANEVFFLVAGAGFILAAVISLIRDGKGFNWRSFIPWLLIFASGLILALFQGGMLTELKSSLLQSLSGQAAAKTYYELTFKFVFPPSVVSSHLGVLSFGVRWQTLAALFETGPIILFFPFIVIWGWRQLKLHHWWEASLIGGSLLCLFSLFFQFGGSGGISGTTRLLYPIFFLCKLFFIPFLWCAARRMKEGWLWVVSGLAGLTVIAGLVMFGVEIISIQKPTASYFIKDLDEQMASQYWNRLPAGVRVFDVVPARATTVLGRPTGGWTDWYNSTPEWEQLAQNLNPQELSSAGYDYAYIGSDEFWKLDADAQDEWKNPCVRLVGKVRDELQMFRRIYDIRKCAK
jgi:hypothetical protein